MKVAIVPGVFDPVTYGHLNVIERAAAVFDRVIVSVAQDSPKSALFTVQERVQLLRQACGDMERVAVEPFAGLVVNQARKHGAHVLVKGLRAVSDFEYEFQMALTNRKLAPDIETLFIMTDAQYAFFSSSMVKEVCRLGGCIDQMVPPFVRDALTRKLSSGRDNP
jgi:pantetheine-phosphate adenylyltransferase